MVTTPTGKARKPAARKRPAAPAATPGPKPGTRPGKGPAAGKAAGKTVPPVPKRRLKDHLERFMVLLEGSDA